MNVTIFRPRIKGGSLVAAYEFVPGKYAFHRIADHCEYFFGPTDQFDLRNRQMTRDEFILVQCKGRSLIGLVRSCFSIFIALAFTKCFSDRRRDRCARTLRYMKKDCWLRMGHQLSQSAKFGLSKGRYTRVIWSSLRANLPNSQKCSPCRPNRHPILAAGNFCHFRKSEVFQTKPQEAFTDGRCSVETEWKI